MKNARLFEDGQLRELRLTTIDRRGLLGKNLHNNAPFFSVVIPVHNKGPHINRSISSVLGQTFGDYELLLIDDASTDHSLEEMQKFVDSRIRILNRHTPGPGGYAARNLGVKEAQSEWVAFLDADDEWCPEHLERLGKLIDQFPHARVMGCGCEIVNPEKVGVSRSYDSYFAKRHGWGDHFLSFDEYLKAEVHGMRPLNGSTACIAKDILEASGGFPAGKAKRGGDVDTWLRCIDLAGGVAWSSYVGAIYYRDAVNMCTRTQPFLAEVERDTVRALLPKYSGEAAKMLKQFANRRATSAWLQNSRLPHMSNFRLLGKLYLSVDTVKNTGWILLSFAPKGGVLGLRDFKQTLKQGAFLSKLKRSFLGDLIRFTRAFVLRHGTRPKPKGEKVESRIAYLSDGKNPTFFGYHDKTPFSSDGSKILAMSIVASDVKPESECTSMQLGYFTKSETGFESKFMPFAETTTWCWQQGCMLQWSPLKSSHQVFFNTLVDGGYGSVVFDVIKGVTVKCYKSPIYSLDPAGKQAATLNFSRLGRLRPGYGYGLLADDTASDTAPQDDGISLLDLSSGKKRLLVSLADLAKNAGDQGSHHYVNHVTFSPDGKRIIFFHLWAQEGDKGRGSRVCEVDPVSGSWNVVESERTVSHYCWRDADCFLATTQEKSGKWHYTFYDRATKIRTDLNLPFNEDGHPMFHPQDKTIIVTDTYPDKRRDQHLCAVMLDTNGVEEIATLYSPFRYRGQVRSDLHPRWDRDGRFVVVDSTHKGFRKMILVEK